MNNRPIGIIDSGIGGISVWKEVSSLLPHESIMYVADQAHLPYGTKTATQIKVYSQQILAFMREKDVKAVVLACNSITVTALEWLRAEFPELPIIGTVPAIKKAVEISKNKKIGVLSTIATARSSYQEHLIEEFASDCDVETIGTDALVPLVEQPHSVSVTAKTVQEVMRPFQNSGCDTIVLGCTHYPFLKESIQKVMGEHVRVIDSGKAIAKQVSRVVTNNNTQAPPQSIALYQFLTTDEKASFQKQLVRLLGKDLIASSSIENLVFPKK